MKKVGILGGLGPQSTELFYHKIIELCQKREGSPYPNILINSVLLWKVTKLLNNKKEAVKYLVQELKKIEKYVDFIVMPCNGMHFIIDELRKASKVPFLAIHEEVAKEISKSKIRRVGVIGTKVTVGNNFYKKALDKYHIKYVGLDEKDEDKLSDIIFNEILPGKERKYMPKIILDYVKKVKKKGCDAVVLACTEMPLFISQKNTKIKLFSSTDILAKSTVENIFE